MDAAYMNDRPEVVEWLLSHAAVITPLVADHAKRRGDTQLLQRLP